MSKTVDISKHSKWLDELETIIRASSSPEQLAYQDKKERGRARYEARYDRIGAERARKSRTRASDVCEPRIGEGIAPNHHLRYVRGFRRSKVKGVTLLDLLTGKGASDE